MKTIIIFCLLTFAHSTFAKFYIQHSFSFESYSEDVEDTKFGTMGNLLFIGASIGGAEKFYFGQSVYIHSFTFNTSASNNGKLSVTEIGPRFVWFLNDRKTWNISGAWHPFAKGTRTLPSATESTTTTATSMIFSIAYQLPVTKFFYLGASLNYYTYSITKDTTAAGTASDVTQKYTHIVPMFDLSFRFK